MIFLRDIGDIDVGTEVAVARRRRFSNDHIIVFAKVTKINRWGHIALDNNMVFDKNGDERVDDKFSNGAYLMSVQRGREIEAAALARHRRIANVKKIEAVLAGLRNGYGDVVSMSLEQKNELVALVAALDAH